MVMATKKAVLEKARKAMLAAGIGELLVDKYLAGVGSKGCDESCGTGCSQCCSSGTANRAASDESPSGQ